MPETQFAAIEKDIPDVDQVRLASDEKHDVEAWHDFVAFNFWPNIEKLLLPIERFVKELSQELIQHPDKPDIELFREGQTQIGGLIKRVVVELDAREKEIFRGYGPIAPIIYYFPKHDVKKLCTSIGGLINVVVQDLETSSSIDEETRSRFLNLSRLLSPEHIEAEGDRFFHLIENAESSLDEVDKKGRPRNVDGLSQVLALGIQEEIEDLPIEMSGRITLNATADPTVEHLYIPREPILQQIVRQLGVNAIEAMKDSGGSIHIDIKHVAATLYIIVSDTGPGIPDDKKETIFSPGYTSRADKTGGNGLTYNLIALQRIFHGTLDEVGKFGKGAKFVITIPLVEKEEEVK